MATKARCSECLAEFRLKKDGTVRYHGPHPKPCPGGGKPPAVMHASPFLGVLLKEKT